MSIIEAVRESDVFRFDLVDDDGASAGTFASRRRCWRVGDWLIAANGSRVRLVAVLPAWESRADGAEAIWVVEPA